MFGTVTQYRHVGRNQKLCYQSGFWLGPLPLFRSDNGSNPWCALSWRPDVDNLVHLTSAGTELDSANAWTPPSGSIAPGGTPSASDWNGITGFGWRITYSGASFRTVKVETWDGSSWTTRQTGTLSATSPSPTTAIFGGYLPKSGVGNEWALLDNAIGETDNDQAFDDSFIDVVREVPVGAGTYTAFSGTYADIDEVPPSSADYISYSTAADGEATYVTGAVHLNSFDVICGMSVAALAKNTSNYNLSCRAVYDGTEYNLARLHARNRYMGQPDGQHRCRARLRRGADTPKIINAEVGVKAVYGEFPVPLTNISTIYKIVAVKYGTAPTPSAGYSYAAVV